MKKEKMCIFLIVMMLCGSLLSIINIESENSIEDSHGSYIKEEFKEKMPLLGYEELGDIGSEGSYEDYYPIHTHLCIQHSTYVYFVPFQNTKLILKLDTSDQSVSLITTETGAITKFYIDRTAERLYFVHSLNTVAYVDLSDDSISDDYTTTTDDPGTLGAIEDIIVYGSDLFIVDTSEDDLTFYKYDAVGEEWDNVGTVAEGASNYYDIGALGGNDDPYSICFDGTYFYVVDADTYVYKYNSSFDTLVASYDIGALGGNDQAIGICFNGTNFFVTDTDGYVYKYPSDFSSVTDSYNVGGISGVGDIWGIEWSENYFYISDQTSAIIYKINADLDTLVATYNLNTLHSISNAIYDLCWDGNYFYLVSAGATFHQLNSDFSILIQSVTIGTLGGNDNPFGITWDDNFLYTTDIADAYVYKYWSEKANDMGRNTYTVIISDKAYVIYQYITGDCKIYVKDLDDTTNPSLLETFTTGLIIPYLENQRGVAVSNDNDTLYFVLKDTSDNKTYLCSYVISTDTFTKLSEYNIALMLDRNTNSSGNEAFDREKGFGLTVGTNSLMVYQIPLTYTGELWKIADLTNAGINTGTIVAVTDTYLFIKETDGNIEIWEFKNIVNAGIQPELDWSIRNYPIMKLTYITSLLQLEENMVLYLRATFKGDSNKIIFIGRVKQPEDLNPNARYSKYVEVISLAQSDLEEQYPSASYSGRTDEQMEDIRAAYCNYIRSGSLDSDGEALGSITYRGGQKIKSIYNDYGAGDNKIWYLTPLLTLQYNDGDVDSNVDYAQSDGNKVGEVEKSFRALIYNEISVFGAFVSGTQVTSSTPAINQVSQQAYGPVPKSITIPWLDTSGLCDTWASALLTLLSNSNTFIVFSVTDSTNGLLQVGETITFEFSPKGITSVQLIINRVIWDDRIGRATYFCSSALNYEAKDFDLLYEEKVEELLGGIAPGVSVLNDISDVNINTPADKHILYYDIVSGEWKNALELDDTNIKESNVTQHQAALSITESQISDLAHLDTTAIHKSTASEITAIDEKAILVANDEIIIEDSVDSNNKKSAKISAIRITESQITDLDHLTEAEAVAAVEAATDVTFSSFPITPSAAPDADYEVANKKYVDDNAGGGYCQFDSGSYVGNAANNRQITGLGFDPRVVHIIHCVGGKYYTDMVHEDFAEWDNISITADAGVLTNRIKLISDGFEVNNNEASDYYNDNGVTYYWYAWG